MAKGNYIKLIFGLKLKQLRQDQKLSLSDLAGKSSLSVSYLNEIESGKKYPKADKIAVLAEALNVPYDKLVSLKLTRNLAPVEELLESSILEKLPLDHYGIDINKMISLMSGSSMQLSALIATFIETAKGSEMSRNNFSRTALRIYKEFNDNYFEEFEEAVNVFAVENNFSEKSYVDYNRLKTCLQKLYNYEIDESSLNNYPDLKELRAVVLKGKKNRLLLNDRLSDAQKAFVVGKELAYEYLGIKDRSYIYSSINLNSFDQLLNYFKVSYFSTALILNSKFFIPDLRKFFGSKRWNEAEFISFMNKYNATPEMFFQRMGNLCPKYLGLNNFFFLRFNHKQQMNKYDLSKELRLNTRRNPGGYQTSEHYCRRWISISTLNKLESVLLKDPQYEEKVPGILHSKFFESNDEYLSISIAQKARLTKDSTFSVTIGFQIDEDMKSKIKFWNDPLILEKIVNDTCENCTIIGCKERVAPPVSAEKEEKANKIENSLIKLKGDFKY